MGANRLPQRLQVVTTFQTGNDAPLTNLLRPILQRARQRNKVCVFEQQLPERVTMVGVEARGNHNQVGLELSGYFIEGRLKHSLLFTRGRLRAQGNIQGRTKAAADAMFAPRAGSRIRAI